MVAHQVQGRGVPRPVSSFDEVGFPGLPHGHLSEHKVFLLLHQFNVRPWPMALSGRDVVAIAQTGSGKTISFALPAMLHINA